MNEGKVMLKNMETGEQSLVSAEELTAICANKISFCNESVKNRRYAKNYFAYLLYFYKCRSGYISFHHSGRSCSHRANQAMIELCHLMRLS